MLKDFLTFDSFITPKIITIIYWINIAIFALGGVASILQFSIMGIISGAILIVVGILFARIGCELMLIAFNIHDQLKSINENTKK